MTGMPLQFAFAVRRLHRQGLDVATIARELGATDDDVRRAHLALALPANDCGPVPSASRRMTDTELDRMPKRIADRIRGGRG